MEKVKYGIIGCGKHALQSHALVTRNSDYLQLLALSDISIESMRKFEKQYGQELKKYSTEEDILNSDIDAVLISTPDECHAQAMYNALEAGKHVFVEKPLGTIEKDLKLITKSIELAKRKNLILTSCHPRRFDTPFAWLKENIKEIKKELGESINFEFDFSYHKPSKDWKRDRGLLLDHANHEIDLLHFIYGYSDFEVTKLIDDYDRYHIVGMREDGLAFSFSGTRRLDSRKYDEFVKIRFERGELTLDAHKGTLIVTNHDARKIKKLNVRGTDYQKRFKLTTDNFGATILGKDVNYLTDKDLYVNNALSILLSVQKNWRCQFRNC